MFTSIKTKARAVLVIALAFVLSLCFGSGAAFAASNPDPDPMPWEVSDDAAVATDEAAITKVLKVPYGTKYPEMGFTFTIEKVSLNGGTASGDVANIPYVPINTTGEVVISYDGAEAIDPAEQLYGTIDGVSTYYLESGDIFANVVWPFAGVFEYKITETDTDYDILDANHEMLDMSDAEYMLLVYVKDVDEDGDPCTPFISAIGAIEIIDDGGVDNDSLDKSDPTPGGNGDADAVPYSGLAFTNTYIKTNGAIDPEDPDPTDVDESTLNISKVVDGEFASLTQYFDFALTLTIPDAFEDFVLPYYPAYVVDADDAIVSDISYNAAPNLIGQDKNNNHFIKFEANDTTEFKLKHGERVVFINTPVGTAYEVEETAFPGYDTTITTTYNGGTPTDLTENVMKASAFVGEEYTAADYLNDAGLTTPTGMDISNQPFIGLIIVALGAFAAWIALRTGKRRSYNQ